MSIQVQLEHEFYDRLIESQFESKESRARRQQADLVRLLHHAKSHVPFYRSRLDAVFTGDNEFDPRGWSRVPILTRQDLLERRPEMLADALLGLQRGPTITDQTSGSTGLPVTVTTSRYASVVQAASIFRAHTWHDVDWSRDLLVWFGDDPADAPAPDGKVGPPWGPGWSEQATGRTFWLNRYVAPTDLVTFLASHDIGYMSARPRAAQSVALEAERRGVRVRLDGVLTFGTGIAPDVREDCRRVFGAAVFGAYSSKEGQLMAYGCPTGSCLHVNEETTLVEILNGDGQPCDTGKTGRVIVTSLFNYAQPIIRYDHGDLATVGEPCKCGRTLASIASVAGRAHHLFRFPDGSTVAPVVPFDRLCALVGAKYFQLAQVAPLRIELRYVPSGATPQGLDLAAELIRRQTHPSAIVNFVSHQDLARADGGKFLEFVNEL